MDWTAFTVFVSITASIICVSYVWYRVRVEMLRKGVNTFMGTPARTGSITLLIGLVSIATGLAFFVNAFIHYFDKVLFSIGLYCLFGGCAFLVYWKVTAKDREKKCQWYEQTLFQKNE